MRSKISHEVVSSRCSKPKRRNATTDRRKVYTKVVKTLKQMMEMSHQGHLVTLAMMITGIVLSRDAQLSQMSSEVPVAVKEKSVEMRLRRWVKHGKIDADVIYMPFARQILASLANALLVLVMDGSQAGRGCMVLMVGVLYKQRALPIAWVAYKGKKGHTGAQRHIQALEIKYALKRNLHFEPVFWFQPLAGLENVR